MCTLDKEIENMRSYKHLQLSQINPGSESVSKTA